MYSGVIKESFTVTKEWILERASEEEIMQYYLNVPINLSRRFRNPLRQDENPTCEFYYTKSGRLKMRDWSWDRLIDIFDVVQIKYSVNFPEALEIIARDLNLINRPSDVRFEQERQRKAEHFKKVSVFGIQSQDFDKQDAEYLSSFGITRSICKRFKCFSVKFFWVNDYLVYARSKDDPAIAYYFGTLNGVQQWKVYFYKRRKQEDGPRFMCNSSILSGIGQLPKVGKHIIWTKSHKDIMAMSRFGLNAVSTQAETTPPRKNDVLSLIARFDKHFSLYDFDRAGCRGAFRLKEDWGITPLFLTNGFMGTRDWGSKDFSDLVRDLGVKRVQKIVDHYKAKLL